MVNWRKYTIQNKSTGSSNPGWVKFELDGYVTFSDGSRDYIYCENRSPFNNYEVGYHVEVDIDRTKYREGNKDIESTSIVRIANTESALTAVRGSNWVRDLTRRVEERGDVSLEYRVEQGTKPDGTYYNSQGWTYQKRN